MCLKKVILCSQSGATQIIRCDEIKLAQACFEKVWMFYVGLLYTKLSAKTDW